MVSKVVVYSMIFLSFVFGLVISYSAVHYSRQYVQEESAYHAYEQMEDECFFDEETGEGELTDQDIFVLYHLYMSQVDELVHEHAGYMKAITHTQEDE